MEPQEYYRKEEPKTIKKFDKEFEHARKYLKENFDDETIEKIHATTTPRCQRGDTLVSTLIPIAAAIADITSVGKRKVNWSGTG